MPGILRPDIPPEAWPVMAAIVVLYLTGAWALIERKR